MVCNVAGRNVSALASAHTPNPHGLCGGARDTASQSGKEEGARSGHALPSNSGQHW